LFGLVKPKLLVGILSDTHDCLPLIDKAVKKLEEEQVELVLHAGDYISPFVIPHFKPFKNRFIGVFGNNDGDHEFLKRRFTEFGLEIRGLFAELKIDGLRIALLHGGEAGGPPGASELLKSIIDAECYDIVVHGHVHEAKVYRKGKTLVVNPGEVCGYLTGKSTIAVLNTKTMYLNVISLK
jgi:putative phosphoesterase